MQYSQSQQVKERITHLFPGVLVKVSGGNGIEVSSDGYPWYSLGACQDIIKWDDRELRRFIVPLFPSLFKRGNSMNSYSTRDAEKKGLSFGVALKGVFAVRPDVSVGSAMSLGFDLADLFGMQGSDQIKAFVQGFVSGIDTTGSTAMTLLEQSLKED